MLAYPKPGSASRSRFARRTGWRRLAADSSGASAVEFALVAPMLLLILGAIVDFGITMNNYVELTDAVRVGARTFVVSSTSATPMTSATTALENAAANLTASNITVTYKVNGTSCSSDTACATALQANPGGTATVTATYPCSTPIGGVNALAGCSLSSTTSQMVE